MPLRAGLYTVYWQRRVLRRDAVYGAFAPAAKLAAAKPADTQPAAVEAATAAATVAAD